MKMRYEEQVDALYLSLDESDVVESEEVKPGIILDFDAAGEVVGIEVLDVHRRVPRGPQEAQVRGGFRRRHLIGGSKFGVSALKPADASWNRFGL